MLGLIGVIIVGAIIVAIGIALAPYVVPILGWMIGGAVVFAVLSLHRLRSPPCAIHCRS